MNITALIDTLTEAGVDAATIVAAVRAVSAGHEDKPVSKAALRTRRWREKRNSVTETSPVTSQTVTSDEKVLPAPSPKEPSKNPPKGGQKGSRILADWQPSEADLSFAKGRGLTDEQIRREADQFRDWWLAAPSAKGIKSDWPATWRTWIRRFAEQHGCTPVLPFEQPKPRVVEPASPEEQAARRHKALQAGMWPLARWGPCPDDIRDRVEIR